MRSMKPIMLVEDDHVDAMTLKRALKDLKVVNKLVHRINGEEALEYLQDKADNDFRRIPVIVFTTSKNEWDRFETFNLSAAGYIVKPADYKSFVETIRTVELYWTLSEFPNETSECTPEKAGSCIE